MAQNGVNDGVPDSAIDPESGRITGVTTEATRSGAQLVPTSEQATSSFPTDGTSTTRWSLITRPIQRVFGAIIRWIKGPQPPEIQKFDPVYRNVQTWPISILNRFVPKRRQRLVLLLAFYFCWLLTFVTILRHSAFASELDGYGKPSQISCLASYWATGNGCGLDGNDCRPFNNSKFAFRCSANCASVNLLNPHAVGSQELVYQPLVVGGGTISEGGLDSDPPYRGDSFICASAIHAGIVSDGAGGCGVVRLLGQRDGYLGTSRHGIRSVDFDSSFPSSFAFDRTVTSDCRDLRWPLLVVSVVFTSLISLFTTSPAVFFGTVFVGIYFHVGLASDPPNLSDYYSIVSILLGRFLPAAFVAFVVYRGCVRRTLTGLHAQMEKTVLWVGGCWVGALTNYTFNFIPIQRLTPHDLNQQPGAKVALVLVILVLLTIALGQVWIIRLEGRLPGYLALYIAFGVCLGLSVAIPGLNLRIHHYILALLLLPGTAFQTRLSLLYQGLLVGLFINGVARWGFDSILQTPAALLGDGQLYTSLPVIPHPIITSSNITFDWGQQIRLASNKGAYNGMSILVNDVERYRGYQDHDPSTFTWSRSTTTSSSSSSSSSLVPYYFRFAFMQDSASGDYTQAGVWQVDGSWKEMATGPSQ